MLNENNSLTTAKMGKIAKLAKLAQIYTIMGDIEDKMTIKASLRKNLPNNVKLC